MVIPVIIAVILLAVDQLTKYLAVMELKPVENITFINGFMDFTFVDFGRRRVYCL